MTKTELTTRIIDRITDPWTDSPEDYADSDLITLQEAEELLRTCREEDRDNFLEPEEKMPEEVTPALLMEVYNCLVRANKHELRVKKLAQFITDNEMVCEYDTYYLPANDNAIDVVPVDFLYDVSTFPFQLNDNDTPNVADILRIGMNSKNTFRFDDEYCWFDKNKEVLRSTDHPFGDGTLDAEAFARFAMEDRETLEYFVKDIMTDDDITAVFGCTAEELLGN